ncbi:MAG: methyltransferase [Paracoccaceae bacterium]
MGFADSDLTEDRFLGGLLTISQPRDGYRAGVDPVLLAAAVRAEPGQSLLELGCGAGVASLCLGRRVPGLRLTGVELQPDYADLARRNAAMNGIPMTVFTADLRSLPAELKAQNFDHVIANPPYFHRSHGTASPDVGRDAALAGETPLADWIAAATQRLAPKGCLTLIQKADRLQDVLSALDHRLGSVTVLPLAPRIGRPAELVIVQARKGGRGAFRLLAPLILHEGEKHERDGESYTATVRDMLRNGAALPINN